MEALEILIYHINSENQIQDKNMNEIGNYYYNLAKKAKRKAKNIHIEKEFLQSHLEFLKNYKKLVEKSNDLSTLKSYTPPKKEKKEGDFVKQIDRNITAALGEDIDPFENNITTLIFSGYDMGGDLNPDVNQSFGWYFDKDKNRTAKSVFAIQNYIQHSNNNVDLNITSITENNNTTLYARYFLVRTAYSIVPIKDESSNDYNLTLYYNYQPWRKDWWNRLHGTSNTEANHTLILNHVTQFRFKKDGNSPFLRIYICLKSNLVDINATNKLEICKEKVIF
jgi:hypothetical protein